MDDMAGMMRAMQLYNIVKVGIPGITQQQLADFMAAQSAERQRWLKTASLMDMADWVVAEMRKQNYPNTAMKRQSERKVISDMFGGNVGAVVPQRESANDILREAILTDSVENNAQKPQAPAKELKKEKCKVCGAEITTSGFTCQNCGNTQWGFVIACIVISIFLVMADFSLFQNQYLFWGVVLGLVALVMLVATIAYVVDAIKIPASLRK